MIGVRWALSSERPHGRRGSVETNLELTCAATEMCSAMTCREGPHSGASVGIGTVGRSEQETTTTQGRGCRTSESSSQHPFSFQTRFSSCRNFGSPGAEPRQDRQR